MSVEIYPNTKVYIACPAYYATGGPEALHQLAYHLLNDLNVEAVMYYHHFDRNRFKTPVHPEYETYNVPYVLEIRQDEDSERNILIVSETLRNLSLLSHYKYMRKGVWFLSVDNYYLSKVWKRDIFIKRVINKISEIVIRKRLMNFDITSQEVLEKSVGEYDYRNDPLLRLADFYMANSYRGLRWFSGLKPLYYLSEYINESYLRAQSDLSDKEDTVAYNPKKGLGFTKKIIFSAQNIEFLPLVNMNREEIIQTLRRTKVYIDFGNHPGRDHLPREAAMLGCCVITGRRGSASFFEDVPVPAEYKFEDKKESIPGIIEKIKDCFENFQQRYKDFEHFRRIIRDEPRKFVEDLKKIFVK